MGEKNASGIKQLLIDTILDLIRESFCNYQNDIFTTRALHTSIILHYASFLTSRTSNSFTSTIQRVRYLSMKIKLLNYLDMMSRMEISWQKTRKWKLDLRCRVSKRLPS